MKEKKKKKKRANGTVRVDRLPAFDGEGRLRVVVETPRASTVKFAFDQETGTFGLHRALPTGTAFPFDFGFVPSTLAEDGDPLDALVLHDAASFPGIVIGCRIVGVVEITQRENGGGRIRNDRLVVVPEREDDAKAEHAGTALTGRRKSELEQFFKNSSLFEGKDIRILRWAGAGTAKKLVQKARKKAKSSRD